MTVSCCDRASKIDGFEKTDRGDWYLPNGTRLNFNVNTTNIYEVHLPAQRVDLHCRNNGDTSGIYRCTVETNAVHHDNESDTTTRETVYAGLYASGGECTHMCI